jgi:small-conductance mechanosensitive channel
MLDLLIQLGSALAVAVIATLVVRSLLRRGRMKELLDDDSRRTIGRSLGLLFVVIAVVLVLSSRNEVIRNDLVLGVVSFMPRLVVGVTLFIVAFVLSRLAGVVVAEGFRNRSAVLAARMRGVVSGGILVVGALLAIKQMGIETDVVVLILGALLAAGAIAAGLAVGLGSLPLARQIAAGRHVEDRFSTGQLIRIGEIEGRIQRVHLASVSVVAEDGTTWEVPHERFVDDAVLILDGG